MQWMRQREPGENIISIVCVKCIYGWVLNVENCLADIYEVFWRKYGLEVLEVVRQIQKISTSAH